MAKKNQITTSDHLDYSEYTRFLSELHRDKEYRWELYALLSFCTACRVSDVINLHWKDVLNKSKVSVIEQKTKKTREIVFHTSIQTKIVSLYKLMERPCVDNYIFNSERTNSHITPQYINKMLKCFKERYDLNINHFSTHTFRKTFGRYVYELNNRNAESLILLNQILNHTSIAVTKRYIGITQDEINNVYNSIRI